jgi:hypothetical protein
MHHLPLPPYALLRRALRLPALLALLLALLLAVTGCSGAGNFAIAPGSVTGQTLVTDYWPNGQLKDRGYVGTDSQGDTVKTGAWQFWFENGQLQWQGSYAAGAIDGTTPWFEWDSDGAQRDTWIDG